ncbi:MAG: DUF2254 domain-containing protein [Solirubrobacterales bacterium]
MSWRTRWKIREFVRNSIWVVPAISVILAIILGILVPDLDEKTTGRIGIAYGAGAAQGMLSAMAGGMITFTGFVFSILLLAVQFGSSQFSPRMLRRFLRDPTTKISLGMFMATFIYALFVLRAIQPSDNENFVPDFSVSLAILLLLLSMIMFLRLISRTTQGLRVAAVLGDLGRDGAKVMNTAYPNDFGEVEPGSGGPAPVVSEDPVTVRFNQDPGILQSVDFDGVVAIAERAGARVELVPPIGDLVAPGDALFKVHGVDEFDVTTLQKSVAVGDERTIKDDPAFVFRLLADISSKALSPGVNDPTTTAQALDQIELLLRILVKRDLTRGEISDAQGVLRFSFPSPCWDDFLSIALDETRIYGEGSIQVSRRLRALLEDLRTLAPASRLPAIEDQIAMLERSINRSFSEDAERLVAGARDRQGIGSPRPH